MGEPLSEKWLPVAWMDEVVPETQADPSAFIRGPVGGLWLIAPEEEPDNEFYRMAIAPGDIVEFDLCRIWPSIEVTIGAGGTIEKHDPIPEGATLFWFAYDSDTINESVEELIKNSEVTGPDTLDVDCYDWSITAKFRLVVDTAGARFEKVEEAATNG